MCEVKSNKIKGRNIQIHNYTWRFQHSLSTNNRNTKDKYDIKEFNNISKI